MGHLVSLLQTVRGEGRETGETLEVAFGLEGWGLVLKLCWHRSHTVFVLCAYLGWHGVLVQSLAHCFLPSSGYLPLMPFSHYAREAEEMRAHSLVAAFQPGIDNQEGPTNDLPLPIYITSVFKNIPNCLAGLTQ